MIRLFIFSWFLFLSGAPVGGEEAPLSVEALAEDFGQRVFNSTDMQTIRRGLSQINSIAQNPSYLRRLNAKDRRRLKFLQDKMKRFHDVAEVLDSCVTPDRRNLIQQMLGGAGQVDENGFLCELSESNQFKKNMSALYLAVNDNALHKKFADRVLASTYRSTMSTFLQYEMQFEDARRAFPSNTVGDGKVKDFVKEFCPQCSSGEKRIITDFALEERTRIATGIQEGAISKYSVQRVHRSINQRVDTLNEQIQALKRKIKTHGKESRQAKEAYDLYKTKYLFSVSDPIGSLFFTESMKSATGKAKALDDFTISSRGQGGKKVVSVNGTGHKKIKEECLARRHSRSSNCRGFTAPENIVRTALGQRKQRLINHVQEMRDLHKKGDLREMVKTSPVAVGHALLNQPNMAGVICNKVMEVDSGDALQARVNEGIENTLLYADLASLGLMGTGVGLIPGLVVKGITSSLRKVAIQGLRWSAAAGMASSGLRGGLGAYQYTKYSKDYDSALGAAISGAQDTNGLERALAVEEKMQTALSEVAWAAIDFAPFGAAGSFLRSKRYAKLVVGGAKGSDLTKARGNMAKVLEDIRAEPGFLRSAKEQVENGALLKDDYEIFLAAISVDPAMARKLIKKMQNMKPDEMNDAIRELSEIARTCR